VHLCEMAPNARTASASRPSGSFPSPAQPAVSSYRNCDYPIMFAFTGQGYVYHNGFSMPYCTGVHPSIYKHTPHVAEMLCLTFGANGSWCMKFVDKGGIERTVGNGLGKKIGGILPEHNLKFMALGQHKDHFCLGDVRGLWQCNLDPYIRDYLTAQAKVLRIGQVALGYSGSCVIVGNDGKNLRHSPNAPRELVRACRAANDQDLAISYIALSLTHPQHFFVQFSDSSIAFCLRQDWMQDLSDSLERALPKVVYDKGTLLAEQKRVAEAASGSKNVAGFVMKNAAGGAVSSLSGMAVTALGAAACIIS